MWTPLRRLLTAVPVSLLLAATAYGGDGDSAGDHHGPRAHGPIFDITHFDVIPLVVGGVDFEQTAYKALFAYRAASRSDPGFESFRIVNWLEASNHSHIIDVWSSLEAFEQHLAQPHSVDFRFAVQNYPPPNGECCIGSPIDDRQYSLVQSFGTPWAGNGLPTTVGAKGALFVVTYVDFLQELLEQGDPDQGQDQLVDYGAATSKANGKHLFNYTVLQQLDRPNRFVALEVWDTEANYTHWQSSAATADFVARTTPLLGSPFDHRLNILCGKTYVDGTGCVRP
jgi:quinol monooxygenase YgiN